MKIAFLQDTVNQNIGLMYLAAILKAHGYQCELFVESLEKDFLHAVSFYQPDIVGFSVITGAHPWVLNSAHRLKEMLPRVLVILGGPHPTYFPEVVKKSMVDVVARGEAEYSFLELVCRLEEGRNYTDVLGLWVKKDGQIYCNDLAPLVQDLSSLPPPDHELYLKYPFYKNQTEVPFSTQRGCPYQCSFCYSPAKAKLYRGKGRFVRTRQVIDILDEMERARTLYPKMRSVILYDDIIGLDTEWLTEFCNAYAHRIGLPWFTSIRADLVDEFVVREVAKANCFCLSLGVETGDEDLRAITLGKKIPNSQYIETARLIRNAGIKVRTSNMFFLPGEDIEKAFKTIDLNREMKVDFAWGYTLQPYPGTAIYNYALRNGYLPSGFSFDDIDPLGLTKPIIKVRDEKKIMVLHRLFQLAVNNKFIRIILKILVFIPPNPILNILHAYSLISSYAKYHNVSFLRSVLVAWSNYRKTKEKRSY